jgi:predicted signal transduction protein with EAL and GGDEF domain
MPSQCIRAISSSRITASISPTRMPDAVASAQPRVLVVDDDRVTRTMYEATVRRAGFLATTASDGPEALAELRRSPPDVMLLDLMMPGMDGFEVCRAARAMPSCKDVAILVMTGLDDVESIREAFAVGATDFVTKPISPLLLEQRVRFLQRNVDQLRELKQIQIRLRRSRSEAERLAYFDPLTGLPNRAFLQRHLDKVLALAARHDRASGLCCIDLDMFKRINDTLGHSAGDELLTKVAERLRGVLRRSDCVAHAGDTERPPGSGDAIVRVGGDEFVVVLSDLRRPEDGGIVAQRILDVLAKPFTVQRSQVFVGASIGIATYPADGTDAETLLKNADAAMYHAKDSGRNRASFYNRSMSELAQRRLEIERELRKAMDQRSLRLAYQPKIAIETGRVVGVEALLRWKHPERGYISPCDFIPVAEDSGLIVPLGAWVLREGCAQLAEWQARGLPPMHMAVNVAARQFTDDGFVAMVRATLDDTQIDADRLELELTEGTLMDDTDASHQVLATLHELGVRLAIDDFGTGYSSLSYLCRFPIDTLKVDRSFVSALEPGSERAAITEAIIAMGRSLELVVVAEGVETLEQLAYLSDLKCDVAQGYYFARPLPPDELEAWIRAR